MSELPDSRLCQAAMAATWPPAATHRLGPWTVRNGAGGGKRVSATTAEGVWADSDIPAAEAAMVALGQSRLFQIRDGEAALDAVLAARGYGVVDATMFYVAPMSALGPVPDAMTAFAHWPPLGIALALWDEAGTDAARIAVMERAPGPKAAVLARMADRAAGVAFVALHGRIAMVDALTVSPAMRRQGAARNILRHGAHWAQTQGAELLGLAVTQANQPARALYASLGMQAVGQYHYRAL